MTQRIMCTEYNIGIIQLHKYSKPPVHKSQGEISIARFKTSSAVTMSAQIVKVKFHLL